MSIKNQQKIRKAEKELALLRVKHSPLNAYLKSKLKQNPKPKK